MADDGADAYYRRRERQERARAAACGNAAVAAIHASMADRYSALTSVAGVEPVACAPAGGCA